MKLLCIVSKILMCWKLCHEISIEDDLIIHILITILCRIHLKHYHLFVSLSRIVVMLHDLLLF